MSINEIQYNSPRVVVTSFAQVDDSNLCAFGLRVREGDALQSTFNNVDVLVDKSSDPTYDFEAWLTHNVGVFTTSPR